MGQQYQPYPPAPAATPYISQGEETSLRASFGEWQRLQQSDGLPFQSYASFLEAHPGWPGEAAMKKTAEQAIVRDVTPPAQIAAFCDRVPPQTPTGHLRYAEALAALGRSGEAAVAGARGLDRRRAAAR